ncbi:hypothetical protein QZH41_001197 [Actinostola sp. cb2023]|nr:hypothetical protein QZH41_001197 [Actinostola sp. cb2023]
MKTMDIHKRKIQGKQNIENIVQKALPNDDQKGIQYAKASSMWYGSSYSRSGLLCQGYRIVTEDDGKKAKVADVMTVDYMSSEESASRSAKRRPVPYVGDSDLDEDEVIRDNEILKGLMKRMQGKILRLFSPFAMMSTETGNVDEVARVEPEVMPAFIINIIRQSEKSIYLQNLDKIRMKLPELDRAMNSFEAAHEIYHQHLKDEDDLEESCEYYEAEKRRVCDLSLRIEEWTKVATPSALPTNMPDLQPCDSASNTSSRGTSKTRKSNQTRSSSIASSSTSISSAKAKAAAKKAILEAEATTIRKRQALQQEELLLKQRIEELKLETEIAKADAEERAYADADDVGHSARNWKAEVKPPSVSSNASASKDTSYAALQNRTTPQYKPTPIARQEETFDQMIMAQKDQNQQIQQLLVQQQRHTLALMLPQPEYTKDDVQELMRSCLSMDVNEGYQEARRLLKERYGQSYKIAAAYVNRLTEGQPIKAESVEALQRFSILLTSCKNALQDIGYLSKVENPDSLKRIIDRLPFGLRLKWRDIADGITEKQEREVTIEDIADFDLDPEEAVKESHTRPELF